VQRKHITTRLIELMEQARDTPPLSSRQREMLQATLRVIQSGGIEALTLRRVADEVGVKLSSVQYHFGNKDRLIGALVNWALEWYSKELLQLVADYDDDPRECFVQIIEYLVDDLDRRTGTEPHLWAYAMHNEEAALHRERYLLIYREFLFELLTQMGTIESENTRWLRASNISALIEGTYQLISNGVPDDLIDYAPVLKSSIWQLGGISAPGIPAR